MQGKFDNKRKLRTEYDSENLELNMVLHKRIYHPNIPNHSRNIN